MIMVVALVAISGTTVFAAENESNTMSDTPITYATLHKVNGTYSDGASTSYTTTTTRKCSAIKVGGTTYDGGTKYVTVTVSIGNVTVANIYNLKLNGTLNSMT